MLILYYKLNNKMHTYHSYNLGNNPLYYAFRCGFKTVELNGGNEKNHWAENPIHTYLITRVSIIILL